MGTVEITLTKHGSENPLFEGIPEKFYVNASHSQTVLKLPKEAKNLAYSNLDSYQAFVVGDNAWGVQFHPEFDAEITRTYIKNPWNKLVEYGRNPQKLLKSCRDTPMGLVILRQFLKLVRDQT
jgi:GMP synthase (glutamine-hydrolysing)